MGAVPTKSGYGHYSKSIGGRSPSLKWPHLYDLLRAKGYDKEKAARISNSRIGMRKSGKLKGLSYRQSDNPKALQRVLRKYEKKKARRAPNAIAAALIAACHDASCAPPPIGSGGSSPAGGGSFSAEKFLKDNPQQPGENFFAWQGRIVADLPPQLQSDVLFLSRETYKPCPVVVDGMNRWCDSKGIPRVNPDIINMPVNLAEADEAARIFENTPDQSNDPEVRAAYEDFKRQNEEMYSFMTRPESEGGMGIEVVFTTKTDPYDTAIDQAKDINDNKRIVLESGLGGDHQATMTTAEYDRFRAIHDVFGHAGIGSGFDRHGEYQAWLVHSAMYTGDGQRAMSTEYRAVNSASWSGAPGSPGTGKSILLPERLTKPPPGALVAAASRSEARMIVKALKLGPDFAQKFERHPWHSR